MSDEIHERLREIKERYARMRGYLDLAAHKQRLGELENEMGRPGFWNNRERAQQAVEELKATRELIDPWDTLDSEVSDLEEIIELAGGDESLAGEVESEVGKLEGNLNGLEFRIMLSRPEDGNNAIFSIQAGAGGTESCDWARMLWRMYTRWCEEKEYDVRILSVTPGEEAGIRSLTAIIAGRYVFGFMKAERGVHRLVRISPFDSNRRRHTSFVSVDVIPELGDDIEVEIAEKDIRTDTYRSSGAGGQHVNVTDSAVRITHLPTGIVVQCQNERSQHKNRALAMKVLKARLHQLELEERKQKMAEHYDEQKKIEWGSQIRSYVFQPYSMVKDHRTGFSVGDVRGVMDGNLDPFILEYLRKNCSLE
ncbi:MAG: peptide chain release factor 2 [PVC group bacterium]